jgi:hypothetical protein
MGTFARVAFVALTGSAACSDAPSNDLTAPRALALASASDKSASTFTTNEVIPFEIESEGECGYETIVGSGRLHLAMHGTITSSGLIQAVLQVNPQNMTASGVNTGATYLVPGMAHEVTVSGQAPLTETFVNNFHLVGLGDAPDFMLHQNMKLTINANGDVTAAFDHFFSDCK